MEKLRQSKQKRFGPNVTIDGLPRPSVAKNAGTGGQRGRVKTWSGSGASSGIGLGSRHSADKAPEALHHSSLPT